MKEVTSLVHELDADLGIGYDGDADRIGAIDDQGSIVYGDRLLALFAGEIIAPQARRDDRLRGQVLAGADRRTSTGSAAGR